MHEDAPKMSVAQSLTGSTSHAKAEMVTDDPLEYDMGTAEAKPAETIDMDIKIAYVDPSNGKYIMLYCVMYLYLRTTGILIGTYVLLEYSIF